MNTSGGKAAVVEWLVHKLDRSAKTPPDAGTEYYSPVPGPEVVRIFYCTNAATPPALQEIVTTVRSVADMRRVFVYNRLKAMIVRDNGAQVMLAAWLIDQLNQPENTPAPEPHEYKLSDRDVARVFELTNPPNPQALQEITTLIRSVADMQRLFIYNSRKAISMRGRPELVALAAWLGANWIARRMGPAPAIPRRRMNTVAGGCLPTRWGDRGADLLSSTPNAGGPNAGGFKQSLLTGAGQYSHAAYIRLRPARRAGRTRHAGSDRHGGKDYRGNR